MTSLIGIQICELKSILRISKALQPNCFWTISSAFNHCECKKWSLTLRWGRDTQSFVVCRAHSGQHKPNWTLVEDVETFFASENPEQYITFTLTVTQHGCCISLLTSSQAVPSNLQLGTLPVSLDSKFFQLA